MLCRQAIHFDYHKLTKYRHQYLGTLHIGTRNEYLKTAQTYHISLAPVAPYGFTCGITETHLKRKKNKYKSLLMGKNRISVVDNSMYVM